MKQFDIKISIDYLNLKVKFPCKISLSLKCRAKQYSIADEEPLVNGNFTAPLKQISNLEAEYNQKEDKFAENQSLSLILYLHSSHGKLLVGSFPYKLNDFKAKKTILEKIRNSPDKNAEIKFTIQVIRPKIRIDSTSQVEDINNKYTSRRQTRFTSLKTVSSQQELPINSPKKQNDFQPYLRLASGQQNNNLKQTNKLQEKNLSPKLLLIRSNMNSPQSPLRPNYPKLQTSIAKIVGQNHSSIQSLKNKLSQVKKSTVEGNQKYLQKIVELQKELKQSKQKISGLQLDLKLKQSNFKYLQKDLGSKKQKAQTLQNEIKQVNKTLSTYEQKIRQLQSNLKHITEQYQQLFHTNQLLIKKSQKREQYYQELISSLNQKYYQIQKEKENSYYKISSLQTQLEQKIKSFNNQTRQKQKKYAQEKNILNKKLSQLQKSLQEKKQQSISFTQKLKTLQKQMQELKSNNDKSQSQNSKLKKRIEELTLSVSKQQMQKLALEQQLKEQKTISHENKQLKKLIQQKEEEAQINGKKMMRMEEEITQAEEKIRQLTQHIHNLQEQYEKLYYQNVGQNEEGERKKKTIEDLIQQNQRMQKNIQRLNFNIKNQANQFQEERADLQQTLKSLRLQHQKHILSLKQTKNQLLEAMERKKIYEKQLLDSKKRIDELQNQVDTLQSQMNQKNHEFNKIKGSNTLLASRIQNLTSQIEELKRSKQQKQNKLNFLSQQNESLAKSKQQEIYQLQEVIDKLNGQIQDFVKHNDEMHQLVQSKKSQIEELKQQITYKRNQIRQVNQTKADLQRNNAQNSDRLIDLHQQIQKLEQQIVHFKEENQELNLCFVQISSQQNQELTHDLRKNRINLLYKDIQNKQKVIQQCKSNIFNLQLQISHLKSEQIHLRQQLSNKELSITKANQKQDEIRKYFDQNLQGLKVKLDEKNNQMLAVSIFKFHQDITAQEEHKTTLQKYQQVMDSLNNKIQKVLQQKNELIATIETLQKDKTKQNIQLNKYKMNQQKLVQEQKQLKSMIKDLQNQIENQGDAKNQFTNKINQISLQKIQLEHSLNQAEEKIRTLQQNNRFNQHRIEEQDIQLTKSKKSNQKTIQQYNQKTKQFNKKLDVVRLQLAQKAKQLTQVEAEKKNRIQVLNNNLDQLKKQNFDLQSVAYAEKSNNTKLNSILNDLTTSINKIESTNNIKTYYMIPIRDLLKKFQEIMEASDKMYTQFQKKKTKKEQKQAHTSTQNYQFAQI